MFSKDQRILVTGSTGLIGKNLIDRLKKDNHTVLGINSNTDLRNESLTTNTFKKFQPNISISSCCKSWGYLC